MICCGAADDTLVRRFRTRPSRSLAVLLLGSWVQVSVASAAEPVDCASIGLGRLDLASGASTFRSVEMNEGDILAFALGADARATGTITLLAGDGRERRLLLGPHATQVSYTAERSGAVRFGLASKDGTVATVVTTCHPARGPGAMAPDGLNDAMSVPLLFGAAASKDSTATGVVAPSTSTLQWLGGEQSGKEAPAGTYGVNLKLQPALMIGVLANFDPAGDPLLGPSALSEQPWLVGPVMSMQLAGGLSLDARAAWGLADPVTGHAANRQTFDARLTSKQRAGPWLFSPSISFAHVQAMLGTAAEPSAAVPGQAVESGRIDVKPEMAYRIDMGPLMYIEPKVMVGTFWNLGHAATVGAATGAARLEPRHMAETGITFGAADGTKLQLGGGVQEGETRPDAVWTGRMQLNIPLK
jgi:hypothetical protein